MHARHRPARRGDLVIAACASIRRVMLLVRVTPLTATGLLIHSAPELATEMDALCPAGLVAPWPAVIEGDLYGMLLRSQIAATLAHLTIPPLPIDPLGAITTLAEALGLARGIELAGPLDPRWSFKQAELDELRPLVSPFWSGFRW